MIEHALGEGLASSVGPEVSCEPEGLVDGQVGLDNEHGGAGGLGLLEHVSSPPVEHSVDTTNCVLRALKTKYLIFRNLVKTKLLQNNGHSLQPKIR